MLLKAENIACVQKKGEETVEKSPREGTHKKTVLNHPPELHRIIWICFKYEKIKLF